VIGASVLVAALAGTAGGLAVLRPWSHHPEGAVSASPAPSPPPGAPATRSGEPVVVPSLDCTGDAPDAYMEAAAQAVCTVLPPLAAMDEQCGGSPGGGCAEAAVELARSAGAALRELQGRTPSSSTEAAADPHLRAALRDFATAGAEVSAGIGAHSASQVARGMADLATATEELSAAGTSLNG
jgi:hypothetical protein